VLGLLAGFLYFALISNINAPTYSSSASFGKGIVIIFSLITSYPGWLYIFGIALPEIYHDSITTKTNIDNNNS
jgi:uncharacterized membrane protein YesL